MTRAFFGRRQALLRQRARQVSWQRSLREELSPEATDELLTEPAAPIPQALPAHQTQAIVPAEGRPAFE
jgi:hypothetical protein